jgi:hypothetical protein
MFESISKKPKLNSQICSEKINPLPIPLIICRVLKPNLGTERLQYITLHFISFYMDVEHRFEVFENRVPRERSSNRRREKPIK